MELRVLLVDDNDELRELFVHLLRREQTHVTAARDGQEAIDCLSQERRAFDLVISDVEMPRVDGWELLAWVREHETALPVALMSANTPRNFIHTAREAGACGAMSKPFEIKLFRGLLGSLFDHSGERRTHGFYCPLTMLTHGAANPALEQG